MRVGRGDPRVSAYAITGRAGEYGYLQRVAVHPDARRRGWGRALVADALLWLWEHGTARVLREHAAREPGRARAVRSVGLHAHARRAARARRRAVTTRRSRAVLDSCGQWSSCSSVVTLPAGAQTQTTTAGSPALMLVAQDAWVPTGGVFTMHLRVDTTGAARPRASTSRSPSTTRSRPGPRSTTPSSAEPVLHLDDRQHHQRAVRQPRGRRRRQPRLLRGVADRHRPVRRRARRAPGRRWRVPARGAAPRRRRQQGRRVRHPRGGGQRHGRLGRRRRPDARPAAARSTWRGSGRSRPTRPSSPTAPPTPRWSTSSRPPAGSGARPPSSTR